MIVFITIPWFAPAYKAGGPIQSIANLVSTFTDNVTYKIFCSNKDLDDTPLENVNENTWNHYNECTQVYYTSNFSKKNLYNEIDKAKPDVLFIIGIFSWQYNILPMLMPFKNKKILSVRGMLHPGALTQKKNKKSIFINLLKFFKVTNMLTFHATDTKEAEYIQNVFGNKAKINIASNFGKQIFRNQELIKEVGKLKLITVALISPMKNYLLVLQALKKCTSTIEYTICGPIKDNSYWQLCLQEIDTMPSNIKVNYIGELLPISIELELQKNHVFIMPSKSENFGHAIFEALSAKLPVITSDFTPWNNLKENFAGVNIKTEIADIKYAIDFFAKMDNEIYQNYATYAHHYFLSRNEIEIKMKSYSNLFAASC